MRIYTRTGDKGETGLLGGKRVSKASARIEAYGTVDELNAILGLAINQVKSPIRQSIERLQHELHIVCADLADPNLKSQTPRITTHHVEELEVLCDELDEGLPPLKKFLLPGGACAGALLHYARTIARRAERCTVRLESQEEINPEVVRYLNRLSDLLFLMARTVNQEASIPEIHPDYSQGA